MSDLDPVRIGECLRQAREAMALSQEAAAREAGLSRPALSLVETGKRTVSAVELATLAKLYNRTLDYFLNGDAAEDQVRFHFRAEGFEPSVRTALIEFENLCRDYRALLEMAGLPGDVPTPRSYPFPEGPRVFREAERVAQMERAFLEVGDQPVRDVRSLLELKTGAKIFALPIPSDTFAGASTLDGALGPCLLVNMNMAWGRRIYTVLHEYAHILVHNSADGAARKVAELCVRSAEKSPIEKYADYFAASFLMPRTAVSEAFQTLFRRQQDLTVEDVVHVQHFFGVSFEAMKYRLLNLRLITQETFERLETARPTAVARRAGYVEPEPNWPIYPTRFEYLAVVAHHKGDVSISRMAEYLRTDLLTARSILAKYETPAPEDPF